ncbi:MAG: DNA-processing protein DprA [Firmicutes bacterium]|nr:DNA-processing protein DprA [Bacillota bacterium]
MNLTKSQKAYLLFSYAELTTKAQERLLLHFNSAEKILDSLKSQKAIIENLAKPEAYKRLCECEPHLDSYIKNLQRAQISILTIECAQYPARLRNIDGAPKLLYYKGDITLLDTKCVAVVGTRLCTSYGKELTKKFTKELVEFGITIVSGLALGIDTIAHDEALRAGGKTIAVLGSGLANIYPYQNKNLAKRIADSGLLMSEYPPDTAPAKHTFPARNRIVSGLSEGVLITEAPKRSGALITTHMAIEQGREVFALPGSIFLKSYEGVNNLIKQFPQAIVLQTVDILAKLDYTTTNANFSASQKDNKKGSKDHLNLSNPVRAQTQMAVFKSLTDSEKSIFDYLTAEGEMHIDKIAEHTSLSVSQLNSAITLLEIKGILKRKMGNIYHII